jgi:hypothetical protein
MKHPKKEKRKRKKKRYKREGSKSWQKEEITNWGDHKGNMNKLKGYIYTYI